MTAAVFLDTSGMGDGLMLSAVPRAVRDRQTT